MPKSSATSGYVYVIGAEASGPVKIGSTTIHPQLRLHQIRAGQSVITPTDIDRATLAVLFECAGDGALERALHKHFRSVRVVGEWFDLEPASIAATMRTAIQEIRVARQDGLFAPLSRVRRRRQVHRHAAPVVDVSPHCEVEGCERPRWLDSRMCRADDLNAWLRSA